MQHERVVLIMSAESLGSEPSLVGFAFDSPIVGAVRERLRERMPAAPPALVPLENVAYAFPESLHGHRYVLEESSCRRPVGGVEADFGKKEDAALCYLLVGFADGRRLEAIAHRGQPREVLLFRDGASLGRLEASEDIEANKLNVVKEWRLFAGARLLGTVARGLVVTRDNLKIDLAGGGFLPLVLARGDALAGFLQAVWRLVSLSFLWRPPPPNTDLVLQGDLRGLTSAEDVAMCFCANVFFRSLVFRFEPADLGGE